MFPNIPSHVFKFEEELTDDITSSVSSPVWSDTISITNPGASTGTICGGHSADTITLSSNSLWSTTTSITNGGYTIPNVAVGTTTQPWFSNSVAPKIKLEGEGADIEVNGWSLIDAVKKIEERLNILTPNAKLEEEWEELWVLGDQYRKLEQHIKEKQATWDKLKAMPPPEVD